MNISAAGIAFIESNEGYRADAYPDADGQSMGYGHHLLPGESFPDGVTPAEAEQLLERDLAPVEAWLSAYETTLSQNQFDACCDFGYNLGLGALQTMLAHGLADVPNQMPRWNHVRGVVSAGLAARRAKEVALWNS